MKTLTKTCFLLLVTATFSAALGQGTSADYERSATYGRRHDGLVYRDRVNPNWFGEELNHFWYRVQTGQNSHQFILVDADAGTRQLAFDHATLARQLATSTGMSLDERALDLTGLRFVDDLSACRFRFKETNYEFALPNGPLRKVDEALATANGSGLKPQNRVMRSSGNGPRTPIRFDNRLGEDLVIFWVTGDGDLRPYGQVAAGSTERLSTFAGHAWLLKKPDGATVAAFVASQDEDNAVIDVNTPRPESFRNRRRNQGNGQSPDQKWNVILENHNVVLIQQETDTRNTLTQDGNEDDGFGGRVWWSPDSTAFVVMRTRRGTRREIPIVESSPDGTHHPRLLSIPYAKPGDELDRPQPVLFTALEDWKPKPIANDLFPNPFDINNLEWDQDSQSFSFLYNQRGHQVLRWIRVDATSAETNVVIDETSDTFICYSQKSYLQRLDETDEAIWMSERSGWNHLYLMDTQTGAVKNAITSGNWVVHEVEKVDPQTRQVWLSVSGIDPGQDPYYLHLIRVSFDGSDLVRLTDGDGTHRWQFSPDNRYLIDSFSRVDLPTVTVLRDADTGQTVCELERGDMTALLETGWQPPERFVAKGRDGETDIFGIIVRPTQFDPNTKYPVLEAIYAGPHSAFVPKNFGLHGSLYEMAELGFIVVKIDGMGTSHRSKAFHDVCWQNLGDSGFPDRIAWIQAAASTRPEMDLTRVGIWGGSAGGQSAMRALIAHGDFYHVAVADCGCHDNRVDKIWWNEQWMGWPIGPHYAEQSNVTQAHRLRGDLLLIWGELDRNVDPASTMQVVDALIKADKDFEQLIVPGQGHGAASHPYAKRRQADFFIRKLWRDSL